MNTGETIALIKALGKGGGGGSSLPSVTSSDNGKVLAVEDGAWAASFQSVIVTVSNNYASLKGSEIIALAESGVVLKLDYGDNGWFDYIGKSGQTTAVFAGVNIAHKIRKLTINDNKAIGGITITPYSIPNTGIPETDLAQAVKNKLNKFIVTLTPTSPDYSGTMDKTVAEINAAYEAGQQIVFRVMMSATTNMDVDCTARWFGSGTYPSFNGFILDNTNNVLLFAYTSSTDDGTKQTYSTTVYSLTPAS